MISPDPANDGRTWDGDTDWFVCACGCGDFWVKRDPQNGLHHLICSRCEADHTMTIFGD